MWMIHLTLLNRTRRAELFIIINSVGCGKKAGMHACPEVGLKFRQSYGRILKEYQAREVNIKDNKDTVRTTLGL